MAQWERERESESERGWVMGRRESANGDDGTDDDDAKSGHATKYGGLITKQEFKYNYTE